MPLRLLNLNVWHGRLPRVGALWLQSIEPTGQSERRYDALIEGLRHYAPDVIFLQECAPQPEYTRRLADDLGGLDAVSAIANAGVRWRGKGLPVGLGTGEGVSILARPGLKLRPFSKRPWILSNGGVATERHSFHLAERRIALAALVTPPGQGDVGLVCTHLRYAFPNLNTVFKTWTRLRGSGDVHGPPPRRLLNGVVAHMRQRDLELEKLGQSLSRLHAAVGLGRMIVGGDFNLDADAAALVEWARANRLKKGMCRIQRRSDSNLEPAAKPQHTVQHVPAPPHR